MHERKYKGLLFVVVVVVVVFFFTNLCSFSLVIIQFHYDAYTEYL